MKESLEEKLADFANFVNDNFVLLAEHVNELVQDLQNGKASIDHTHNSIKANLSGTTKDLKFVVTDEATYTGMTKDSNTLYFVQE